MNTVNLVRPLAEEMTATRRHIHQHPELSYQEFQTTKLIQTRLREYGVEILDVGLNTGVIALIRGGKPGKTLAIREDIDALPMQEQTGLPFASQAEGVCHACGHDIHCTILLYCAKLLQQLKDELAGNVLLLFQPAEERGTGALEITEKYLSQPDALKPEAFIGLHCSPELPVGSIGLKKGPANASSDMFSIQITGKGGHGAHPENFVDPVTAAAYILTQMQTIVSREAHPVYPTVLTVGRIQAGTAFNIVPDCATMDGTLRTLTPESRQEAQRSIDRIVTHGAQALRTTGQVNWTTGMPPLVNDPDIIDQVAQAASKTIGADHIVTIQYPSLGSDDFSYMFPQFGVGAQFRLGTGSDDPDTRHGLHSSKNVFDDRCVETGVTVLVQFARDFLN